MIINLLCKAFIAILDILLLDFYLKNIYSDIYRCKARPALYITYIFIFIRLMIASNLNLTLLTYLLSFLLIIFILNYWKIPIINSIQTLSIFFLIKIFVCHQEYIQLNQISRN